MPTTVTSKGQVTIPVAVRTRLGIRSGDAVSFEMAADGQVMLRKVEGHAPQSRFEALRGRAGAGLSTDEIMALTRGED